MRVAPAGPGAGAREEPGVHQRAGGAWRRSRGDGLWTAGNSATAAWSGHRPGRESTGPEPARATAVRAGRCGIRAGTSARGRGRAARGMRWHPECRGTARRHAGRERAGPAREPGGPRRAGGAGRPGRGRPVGDLLQVLENIDICLYMLIFRSIYQVSTYPLWISITMK